MEIKAKVLDGGRIRPRRRNSYYAPLTELGELAERAPPPAQGPGLRRPRQRDRATVVARQRIALDAAMQALPRHRDERRTGSPATPRQNAGPGIPRSHLHDRYGAVKCPEMGHSPAGNLRAVAIGLMRAIGRVAGLKGQSCLLDELLTRRYCPIMERLLQR